MFFFFLDWKLERNLKKDQVNLVYKSNFELKLEFEFHKFRIKYFNNLEHNFDYNSVA